MRKIIFLSAILVFTSQLFAQVVFTDLYPDDSITEVQPMTGIVYWNNSGNSNTDAISLEFSYMLFNDIVSDSGVYDWTKVEDKLDEIAARKHQAIFRFRYVYPGYETSVPDYILSRDDYNETVGKSEGKDTHFPDWTNEELKRFTMEFYTKFAAMYDNDPRLAFIQVGFGLWAEYHIYSGPFTLGVTFPSKEFQEEFFYHLDSTFINIPWSISIDAASTAYTPFSAKPELKNIKFGLFDDSFMHQSHAGYNTTSWNFFDRDRYLTSPAGGEFSFYSDYDQGHVLDYPNGPYGKPYEYFARDFHITYIMGSGQPKYQTTERIKQASMASGYRFKIESLKTATDTSVFEILNYGVAPIYYDAYLAVDGVRSPESLKLLAPGETKIFSVSAGAEGAVISIECDKLVEGQEIQFYGTQELPLVSLEETEISSSSIQYLYPNPVRRGEDFYIAANSDQELECEVYNLNGKRVLSKEFGHKKISINTSELIQGIYMVKVVLGEHTHTDRLLIL